VKKNATVSLGVLLSLLALGGTTGLSAQALAAEPAQAQADAFLTKARASLVSGQQSDASNLLGSALQLAPDYSEALYLRAELELPDRATTLAALSDLQRALASGSWTVTDPWAARQTLAELLLRIGRLTEAQALLLQLASHDPSDWRAFLLLATAYDREGDVVRLRQTLSDAGRTFPLQDDFVLLSARLMAREGNRLAARRLIARQLKVHPDSLPLLLQAAGLEQGAAARVAAVDRYTKAGGKDPLAAVIALEAPASDQQKYLSQFLDNDGLAREDLVERVARLVRGSRKLSAAFQAGLSGFSGDRDLDPQGDGYQERWTFQDGALTSWARDTHKDGQPELSATFQKGSPASLTIRTAPGAVLTLSYSSYPFVESAKAASTADNSTMTFLLVPYSVRFPFLVAQAVPGAVRVIRNPGSPSLDQLRSSSYADEEHAPDGTPLRKIELLRGKTVFMEENTLGKGAFDHRVWYDNGEPVRGERDLDGSGKFAVKETWRDGKLASIAVDTNGDGKVDYHERYVPSPMKSWDYNGDGIDDSREYPAGPETIVREFSMAMNGVFDVSFVWTKGELVRVVRGGHPVAVMRDALRGVVWIGPEAPGGVQIDVNGPEGYQTISGKQYLMFRHEGVTYVEELP